MKSFQPLELRLRSHETRLSSLSSAVWFGAMALLGGGVGILFGMDPWFASLLRPIWAPSPRIIALGWFMSYLSIGLSVWLIRKKSDSIESEKALRLFLIQLTLHLCGTTLLFGLHNLFLGFAALGLLWPFAVAMALAFGKSRPMAGYLLAPYLLWVSWALILSGTMWWINA